jgi:hypothetical protein
VAPRSTSTKADKPVEEGTPNESSIPGHLENLAAGNNTGFESSPPRRSAAEERAFGEVGAVPNENSEVVDPASLALPEEEKPEEVRQTGEEMQPDEDEE